MASYRVGLRITSVFSEEGEPEEKLESTCTGVLRPDRDGWVLCWRERDEAGTTSCRLRLLAAGADVAAELQRSGAQSSRFSFAPEKRRPLHYEVSGYAVEGAVTCRALGWDLCPRGGYVKLEYVLEWGGMCRHAALFLEVAAGEEVAHGNE